MTCDQSEPIGPRRSRRRFDGRWPGLALAVAALLAGGCGDASSTADPGPLAPTPPTAVLPPKPAASRVVGDRLSGVRGAPANPTIPQEPSPFRFTDIRPESGVDFVHVSGMTEEKHFPTANGSGVAIFDYDGDGRMDLYFASCNPIPPGVPRTGRNRLYRNLDGARFEDVTDRAGVGFVGFNHGVIAEDLDADGDPDLVLCNYGPNVVYRNNGDGTFTDVGAGSGLDVPGWSSGGCAIDYDGDGDLDLYIANYGEWKYPEDNVFCGDPATKHRLYCSPKLIRTVRHYLYRNEGGLRFRDATEEAGIARGSGSQDYGHGFAAAAADVDGDGDADLYVSNDLNANFLFLNGGDGTFRDATEISGAAYDERGNAQSGMGIDVEDVDGDGRPELFVTNFSNEYNTLYQNFGNGVFSDMTPTFGFAADSMSWVGWGCGLVDLDNDGWPDSFVANGHVDDNREDEPYAEPPLLHRNVALDDRPDASRRFKLATRDVGPYFAASHVARGVSFGDLDNDGDLDIVVCHKDGPPAILRNDTPAASGVNHWIRLDLRGPKGNRAGIGATVEVVAGGLKLTRLRKSGQGLMGTSDPRMLIGIGPAAEAESVVVRWPGGAESRMEHVAAGSEVEVVRPGGDAAAGER